MPAPITRPKRGGARPGAGRKPRADTSRKTPIGPILLTKAEAATFRERVAQSPYSAQDAMRAALRSAKLID